MNYRLRLTLGCLLVGGMCLYFAYRTFAEADAEAGLPLAGFGFVAAGLVGLAVGTFLIVRRPR